MQLPRAAAKVKEMIVKSEASGTTCPKCGSSLVFRTARYGTRAGQQFYGCRTFPSCRYMRPLDGTEIGAKELDPSKINFRTKCHTSSSMIKEGVYPIGTTQEQVIEAIGEGTFGGRFESFGDGKFKYIAYTD